MVQECDVPLSPISYQHTRLLCLLESFSIAVSSSFLLLKLLFTLYISCLFSSPKYPSIWDSSHLISFKIPSALPAPGAQGRLFQLALGALKQRPAPPIHFGKSLLWGSGSVVLQRMLMGRASGAVPCSQKPVPGAPPYHVCEWNGICN